ncbi:MAG: hypothetical protein H0U62_05670, partial [Actinobacteria bacterium]|nr:hypothetical protein [Actinomycetota bacterium]
MSAYAEQVSRGEHDAECEFGPREHDGRTTFMGVCHCSKRRREWEGSTTPPGPVIHNPPSCPRCDGDVWHDGDGWQCDPCHVSWGNDGDDKGEFTDYHGDLSCYGPRK